MITLKLTKGRSYKSGLAYATAKKPYVQVEDQEAADKLVATGYFSIVETTETAEAAEADTETETAEVKVDFAELAEMSKAQLEEYAAANGIDISGCKTKAQILAVVSEAYGGSAEMAELQES